MLHFPAIVISAVVVIVIVVFVNVPSGLDVGCGRQTPQVFLQYLKAKRALECPPNPNL